MLETLLAALDTMTSEPAQPGVRNLLAIPAVRALARAESVRSVAEESLGANCFAVKATLFDKTAAVNWKVPWHQDLTIAVREKRDVRGFGPWTVKQGVPHVQPPADILGRMLALRVHLDACAEDNGPLRVIPGSHRSGRLSAEEIAACARNARAVVCPAPRGGILAFRPLLLHASSPTAAAGHRRVVHIEFACEGLPAGLEWAA